MELNSNITGRRQAPDEGKRRCKEVNAMDSEKTGTDTKHSDQVTMHEDKLSIEVDALRDQLSAQSLQIKYLQKYQAVVDQMQELKFDVNEKWLRFKVTSIIGTAILAAAGLIGYHSANDVKNQIYAQIQEKVEEKRVFYDDLMSGAALSIQQNYAGAIPRLMKCFNNEHEYDKSVLLPLLFALNLTDDWEEAVPVIDKLRSDSIRFDRINDAPTYTVIGSILIQSGVSQSSISKDVAQNRMDQGTAILKRALGIVAPNDLPTRMHIYNNLWINYAARGNFQKSQDYVDGLKRLPDEPEARVYSWKEVSTWRCMRDLSVRDSGIYSRAANQWQQLASRYKLSN
jgi:hypothetical protein